MSTILENSGIDRGLVLVLLILLILVLVFVTLFLYRKVNRLTRKYQIFMKGADGRSMEKAFLSHFEELDHTMNMADAHEEDIETIKDHLSRTLTHYGIVRYDAFDDVGGKMSFAIALLDDDNNGFILNTVHSNDNCFLYLKEIVKGESYTMLSNEEIEALEKTANVIEEENFE